MNKKFKKYLIVTIAILLFSVLALLVYQAGIIISTLNTDRIYEGVLINGINVGGLTTEEAKEKLLNSDNKISETLIIKLKYGTLSKDLFYNDIVAESNLDDIITNAYNLGRDGSMLSRFSFVKALKATTHNFDITYTVDKGKLITVLEALRADIECEPVNATMSKNGDEPFVIIPEIDGVKIDYEKTFEDLTTAVAEKRESIDISVLKEKPKYTVQNLSEIQTKLGSFSTKFNSGDRSRTENLVVATNYIDKIIIEPGEVFSVNNTIKERTVANGYKIAHVIVNGEYVDGIGGGICQVASTLYNAVLLAELEVVERHNHSLTSTYVNPGFDATVSGNELDFKFRNNTNKPIYIQGIVKGGTISYTVYGDANHMSGNRLEFQYVITKTIPAPEDKIIEDPTLPVGTRKVQEKGKNGMVVKSYRLTYDKNNTLISKEQISQSSYRAMRGTVIVGTKPNPTVPVAPVAPVEPVVPVTPTTPIEENLNI